MGDEAKRPSRAGPRERLFKVGPQCMSDSELLAVLLGTGTRNHPVDALAHSLLSVGGGVRALVHEDPHELCQRPGLGKARAAQVLAALELGRRTQLPGDSRPRLTTPEAIYRHVRPHLAGQRREVFHVLCFNARHVLLRDARIAEGTMNACPVDPREVFAAALSARCTSLVLVHNHPSGDPEPSAADIHLTQQLHVGAAILGFRLLDHLVIGERGYCSMLSRGLLSLPTSKAGAP